MPAHHLGSRHTTLQLLLAITVKRKSLSDLLPLKDAELSAADQALVGELTHGVCRWYQRLQTVLAQLLKKPLRQKDLDIELLLILGLYQLFFTRIPAHAAINETVQLTRAIKKNWASGMANAVLRRAEREQDKLIKTLADHSGYRFAHPGWLIEKLQQEYPRNWPAICDANNARAPMSLRINQLQCSRSDYLNKLREAGINAQLGKVAPQAIILESPQPVAGLPYFEAGLCSVQDESAQLAATLLAPRPGERILDACAAPGGKTGHILEQENKVAALTALDINPERCKRISENLARLDLHASVVTANAATPDNWWDGTAFDRILLDAPCSATGVIRRHPDIKLLRRPEDIAKLASHQFALISALWTTLKPGGTLLYATCSILPAENDDVVGKFVQNQPDASHTVIEADWGTPVQWGRQLLPTKGSHDGFYYALLKKSKGVLNKRL